MTLNRRQYTFRQLALTKQTKDGEEDEHIYFSYRHLLYKSFIVPLPKTRYIITEF